MNKSISKLRPTEIAHYFLSCYNLKRDKIFPSLLTQMTPIFHLSVEVRMRKFIEAVIISSWTPCPCPTSIAGEKWIFAAAYQEAMLSIQTFSSPTFFVWSILMEQISESFLKKQGSLNAKQIFTPRQKLSATTRKFAKKTETIFSIVTRLLLDKIRSLGVVTNCQQNRVVDGDEDQNMATRKSWWLNYWDVYSGERAKENRNMIIKEAAGKISAFEGKTTVGVKRFSVFSFAASNIMHMCLTWRYLSAFFCLSSSFSRQVFLCIHRMRSVKYYSWCCRTSKVWREWGEKL